MSNKTEISAVRFQEELANSITHGIGVVLSIAGLVLLVIYSSLNGNVWHIVSSSIFGASMIFLYTASTFYHSFTTEKLKYFFKILDHSFIYILIAGTYTPFTLVTLHGWLGWTLFGIIWGLAISGVVFKFYFVNRFSIVSTVIYLLMGWLIILAINPLMDALPFEGLIWLIVGGLSYSFGVIFYVWHNLKFSHGIWHLFVLGGTICHFFSVFFYVIP